LRMRPLSRNEEKAADALEGVLWCIAMVAVGGWLLAGRIAGRSGCGERCLPAVVAAAASAAAVRIPARALSNSQ